MKGHILNLSILLVIVGFVAACQQPATEQAETVEPVDTTTALVALSDTFIEMWNTKNYDLLDNILTEDFQRVAPDQNANGLDEMKVFAAQVHQTYPDMHITIDESAYGDDIGFVHWTFTGTPSGSDPVEVSGITMLRYRDGKISHEIVKWDTATIAEQLGGIPHMESE